MPKKPVLLTKAVMKSTLFGDAIPNPLKIGSFHLWFAPQRMRFVGSSAFVVLSDKEKVVRAGLISYYTPL
jgi:hypothetical protein